MKSYTKKSYLSMQEITSKYLNFWYYRNEFDLSHFYGYTRKQAYFYKNTIKLYNFIKDHTQEHSIPDSLNGAITYF